MIIEFIGLPGSGKSYIATKLEDSISSKVYNRKILQSEKISIFSYITFLIKNIMIILPILIGILFNFSMNIKNSYALIIGIRDTFKIYAVIDSKKYSENIIILDEGILQKVIFLFYYNPSRVNDFLFNFVLQRLRNSFITTTLIYVDRDIKNCIENAKNRDAGLPFRFRYLTKKDLVYKFNALENGLEKVFDFVTKNNIKTIKASKENFDYQKIQKEIF